MNSNFSICPDCLRLWRPCGPEHDQFWEFFRWMIFQYNPLTNGRTGHSPVSSVGSGRQSNIGPLPSNVGSVSPSNVDDQPANVGLVSPSNVEAQPANVGLVSPSNVDVQPANVGSSSPSEVGIRPSSDVILSGLEASSNAPLNKSFREQNGLYSFLNIYNSILVHIFCLINVMMFCLLSKNGLI